MIDCVKGEAVFIGEEDYITSILNIRRFAGHEFQTNWLIGFRMDFNYEIKIINKKHPKHKQILKMINILVENGIKQRSDFLYDYGIVISYYSFEKLSSSEVFKQIRFEMNKERDQITLNELSSVFALLFAAVPCLFVAFILEMIIYKYKRNLTWL